MRIVVTGTPGTGKSTIAKMLGKKLEHKVLNEREFCEKKKIGKFDVQMQELIVPIGKLEKELNRLLDREKKIIIEGHLLCETKLKADLFVLLRASPDLLEERLKPRHYPEFKIQDNVLCEGIDYCKKRLLRKNKKSTIIEIKNEKSTKETIARIMLEIKAQQKANNQKIKG